MMSKKKGWYLVYPFLVFLSRFIFMIVVFHVTASFSSITIQLMVVSIVDLVLILLMFLFLYRYLNSQSVKQFPISLAHLIYFFGVMVLQSLMTYMMVQSFPTPANQIGIDSIYRVSMQTGNLALIFFGIDSFLQPIFEEFLFRGLIMELYFKGSKYYLDVLLSALLFALCHLISGFSWTSFSYYFFGGLVFPLIYRRTRSIYYPILLHLNFNFLGHILYDFWSRVF